MYSGQACSLVSVSGEPILFELFDRLLLYLAELLEDQEGAELLRLRPLLVHETSYLGPESIRILRGLV